MTWPRRYGGQDASGLARFVVIEELLAAGAPVAAHWMAERQTGPLLLRHGTEAQRRELLPAIARGELYVSIGLSEPDSGSDLASVRTRAKPKGEGWVVNGQKVWTSHAHRTHYLVALVRTGEGRHAGLSQMLIPLDAPGVTLRPIRTMAGEADFCEVFLDEVHVPAEDVIGTVGEGWKQVTSELANERAGPERFLSVHPLLAAWIDGSSPEAATERRLGATIARLWSLRCASVNIASVLDAFPAADLMAEAAMVKDRGTLLEQDIVEQAARETAAGTWIPTESQHEMLQHAVRSAPSFTLRGGTNEILRTIIARNLEGAR